ncbi:MAG: hypothetical protein GX660_29170 [Clostridiaceae bacterium]|nr:hypothetical protein [Clostridiaceae bacterium]
MKDLKSFNERKARLALIIDKTSCIFQELEDKTEVTFLSELKQKLISNKFKVLVIGEFKRGKSTFINALLHEEILPAYSVPCTAIINEIKYSNEKKAIIYFKDKPQNLSQSLAPEIKEYVNAHSSEEHIPPLTVDIDELEDYVTITDVEKEQSESVAESPFEKAEIYVPLELCQNGIEIIDSPGLNEHSTRDKVTNDYASNVDAMIFVLLCQPLASGTELQSIDDFRKCGHESIFFICNCFDLIREKERPRVIEMAKNRLGTRTNLGEKGLHFVSSLDALEARADLTLDKMREEASNFPKMEAALSDFLINERGRIKLTAPSITISEKLEKGIKNLIQSKLDAMGQDTATLKEKYIKLESDVNDLKERGNNNLGNLEGKISQIEQFLARKTYDFITSLAEKIPGWVNSCEPSAGLGILFTSKADIENVTSELVSYANTNIEQETNKWQDTEMIPAMREELEKFKALAESYIVDFQNRQEMIAGFMPNDESVNLGSFYADSGIDSEIFADLCKMVVPSILTGIGCTLLTIVSPWIVIPALFAAGGLSRLFSNDTKMEKIKDNVGRALAEQVRNEGAKKLVSGPSGLNDKLKSIVESIREAFDRKLKQSLENAENAMKECERSESDMLERKRLFEELLAEAEKIERENKQLREELK